MASSENGATHASRILPLPAGVGFDSNDCGPTFPSPVLRSLSAAAHSAFNSDDNGATRGAAQATTLPLPAASATTYYKMRALDASCAPAKTYRTWVVSGTPDATGARYTGAHCGGSVNFADIVVEDTWQV